MASIRPVMATLYCAFFSLLFSLWLEWILTNVWTTKQQTEKQIYKKIIEKKNKSKKKLLGAMVRFVYFVVVSLFWVVVMAAAASASPSAAVHRHHHPGKLFIYLFFIQQSTGERTAADEPSAFIQNVKEPFSLSFTLDSAAHLFSAHGHRCDEWLWQGPTAHKGGGEGLFLRECGIHHSRPAVN